MTGEIEFEPAWELRPDELAALWNRAYAGYFEPLYFTPEIMAAHVRRNGIDLERSLVGRLDGEPFGLSLAAIDGPEAWIGGFGIAQERRRRGLASELMAAHVRALDGDGITRIQLEVIRANPAREVYARTGFRTVRELLVLGGTLPEHGVASDAPMIDEVWDAHARLHPARPVWRRDRFVLERMWAESEMTTVGVRRGAKLVAYALVLRTPERLAIADAAAEDMEAAHALLAATADRFPGATARLVDEPETTPLAQAMLEVGFESPLGQYEMIRLLPRERH